MPTKEAGNYYAFSLPVSPGGNTIVYFLSTESQHRSNTIVIKEPKTEDGQGLKYQNESTVTVASQLPLLHKFAFCSCYALLHYVQMNTSCVSRTVRTVRCARPDQSSLSFNLSCWRMYGWMNVKLSSILFKSGTDLIELQKTIH